MIPPVDLTNLHEMTGDDEELERSLFQEFLASSDQMLQTLEANCLEGTNESWRTTAHALKGMAYNLGAQPLGDLCKQAQDGSSAPLAEKQAMLQAILSAYAEVRIFLENSLVKV